MFKKYAYLNLWDKNKISDKGKHCKLKGFIPPNDLASVQNTDFVLLRLNRFVNVAVVFSAPQSKLVKAQNNPHTAALLY